MVDINIDSTKYEHTTKNSYNLFYDEVVIDTKDIEMKFYFAWKVPREVPCLLVGDKEYEFDSIASLTFFLQKLSLNSTLITSLSNKTLETVVNERLQDNSSIFNLIIDNNTNKILSVTTITSKIVSWSRIIQTVNETFMELDEKLLYCTTHAGLGISIVMSDPGDDLDVIRIEPQTTSSISLYRGTAREEIPLKGYDEDEIIKKFREKLQVIMNIDPSTSKNSSLVRD